MVAKRIFWAVCVALVAPSLAHALGLGDIRLSSALNQPLDAEIDLLNATPEELAGLQANLASRETFARYGLDYPNFLSSVALTRGKSASGRDVLKITSAETMTEPFVSLLVEVNWGRGRLVREYTVLLDPPVFAPNTPRVADAAAPVTTSPSAGSIVRPAPAEQAPEPAAAQASGSQDTYAVRRGDSLSGIAQRLAGAQNTNQLMLGIYRTNPEAFEGSMNVLRAGSVLRIPDNASVQAIPGSEAAAEVGRQFASWRGQSGGATGSGAGRLRLVAPSEAGAGGGGATAAEVKGLRDQLARLEGDLAQSKRLLELRNAELAALQKQLAVAQAAAGMPVTPAAAPVQAPPAAAATTETSAPAQTTSAPAEVAPAPAASETAPPAAAAATETPPPAEAAPVEAPPVEQPMRARVRDAEAAGSSGPSLLDTVTQLLSEYWYLLAGLLALLAGLFGYRKFAERRSDSGLADQFAEPEMSQEMPPPRAAEPSSRRGSGAESRMVVEESSDREPSASFGRGSDDVASQTTTLPGSDSLDMDPGATLSGDTGANLDSADPLAEADFHMAYGLYDQAADLVRGATLREPQRLDLKLKLVEVFFVWGNRNEFVRLAKQIHDSGEAKGTGDWEKIVIMGRQIAPEESMFSQNADSPGIAAAGVDLDLAGGSDNRIDFDVEAGPQEEVVDLDLGAASQATEQALGEDDFTQKATVNFDIQPMRDNLRENQGNTTRQMAPEFELPGSDTVNRSIMEDSDAPTVEQPALRTGSPTIREKIDAAKRFTPVVDDLSSTTAEVAIDDLGLDIGEIEGLDLPDDAGEPAHDAPTLVAGLDSESRRMVADAAERHETGATATLAALDGAAAMNLDFEVGDKTLETPAMRTNGGRAPSVDHGFDLDSATAITKGPAIGDTMVADDLTLPPPLGAEGRLSAVDLAKGARLWSEDTAARFGVAKGFFGAAGSPLVENGRVIANVGGRQAGIVAFDAKSGKVLWTATEDEASYSSPVGATIGGRRYAVFLTRAALVGLDPGTGRVEFRRPWRARAAASVNAASPVVLGNLIFVSAEYGPAPACSVWRARTLSRSGRQTTSCRTTTPRACSLAGFSTGITGGRSSAPASEPLRCAQERSAGAKNSSWRVASSSRVIVF